MAGPKPKKESAPKKEGAEKKSSPNTTRSVFLDTAWKSEVCQKDRDALETKCAPKPKSQKIAEKKRTGGALRHIRKITAVLDTQGKLLYDYLKGTPNGNEWMDDYCDGMWVKPQFTGIDKANEELIAYKASLDALSETINRYINNPDKILETSYKMLAREAVDKLGYVNVENMVFKKLRNDALVAAVPSKHGFFAKIAAAAKIGFSAAGYMDSARQLAAALGSDYAKDILQGMEYIIGEQKDRLIESMQHLKDHPDRAMAEMMSLNAEYDGCLKARKCKFVSYENTSKKNTSAGNGCCPGQTGHRVIPDSAVRDAKCKGYSQPGAPTICVEGQDNNYGSHGRAHKNLNRMIVAFNGPKQPPKPIAYIHMRNMALEALKESIEQCKKECLEKQLDDYYESCNDLVAKSGKGGAIPKGDAPENASSN